MTSRVRKPGTATTRGVRLTLGTSSVSDRRSKARRFVEKKRHQGHWNPARLPVMIVRTFCASRKKETGPRTTAPPCQWPRSSRRGRTDVLELERRHGRQGSLKSSTGGLGLGKQ
ncbi:hypothetical protein MRX96_011740 [Rhipicephalus microplus]